MLSPKWFLPVILGLALTTQAGHAPASPSFLPIHPAASRPAPIVDEPIGARSSLGLTLWHMGHDPQRIQEFHQFLTGRGENLEKLSSGKVPAQSRRILIEPERLPADKLNGWQAQGDYLQSGAGDIGPQVEIPLRVERAGLYRAWIKFHGWPSGTGVTGLRIYRTGKEAIGPLVNDQIYDHSTPTEGLTWQSFMVDLTPGVYTIRLNHISRSQQAGTGGKGYMLRLIDSLYFTDEIWKDAPADHELKALRQSAPPAALQLTASPEITPAERAQWRRWLVRPLSWEESAAQPRLFALSREFWRRQVDAIAAQDYGTAIPDYREPSRQVIFDDIWNLCANPVQIRRRIETLRGDLLAKPSPYFSYWLKASDFQNLTGGWSKNNVELVGHYGNFEGTASSDLAVGEPGEYAVWVHFGNLRGYYAPWRLNVSNPAGETVTFERLKTSYDSDWQKVGVLKMDKAGLVHFEVKPLAFQNPGTYRRLYNFLLTTDPNYVPSGTVRPPLNLNQYTEQARMAGASDKDAYLMWVFPNAYTPLAQEVWDANSWPAPKPQGSSSTASTRTVVMTANSQRAVQVGLRSLRTEPIRLNIRGSELRGRTGRFPGKVSWRVQGFVPIAESSRNWSPFVLLRRPWVTIPPRSAAGIWLTVDSTGVPPGSYTCDLEFESAGVEKKRLTLQVQVTAPMNPRQPILLGGYTLPPEGDVYTHDYHAHGMNIWYSEMSKADMQRYGIKLLALNISTSNEAEIAERVQRLQALGLEYSDWMFTILDEPSGDSEEKLKPYLDIAKAIRNADPRARISFNPGDAATLATFKILDPWCDVWMPFEMHLGYPPGERQAKLDLITAKPWFWYTTPCLWDKNSDYPEHIYRQIRAVPAQPGNVQGTTFFAFYYPFRDAWDTAHETLPDAAVTVLPSRHGPVSTRPWEAIREAGQTANLARALKEKLGEKAVDPAAAKLIHEGTVAELVAAYR